MNDLCQPQQSACHSHQLPGNSDVCEKVGADLHSALGKVFLNVLNSRQSTQEICFTVNHALSDLFVPSFQGNGTVLCNSLGFDRVLHLHCSVEDKEAES